MFFFDPRNKSITRVRDILLNIVSQNKTATLAAMNTIGVNTQQTQELLRWCSESINLSTGQKLAIFQREPSPVLKDLVTRYFEHYDAIHVFRVTEPANLYELCDQIQSKCTHLCGTIKVDRAQREDVYAASFFQQLCTSLAFWFTTPIVVIEDAVCWRTCLALATSTPNFRFIVITINRCDALSPIETDDVKVLSFEPWNSSPSLSVESILALNPCRDLFTIRIPDELTRDWFESDLENVNRVRQTWTDSLKLQTQDTSLVIHGMSPTILLVGCSEYRLGQADEWELRLDQVDLSLATIVPRVMNLTNVVKQLQLKYSWDIVIPPFPSC